MELSSKQLELSLPRAKEFDMLKWSVPLWRRWDWHRWRRAYIAHTPKTERRAWLRYPINLETSCQTSSDPAGCVATIRNISLGGMNLVVDRPFPSGTLLKVEVQSSLENTPQMLCVRVIHVAQQPDGTYSLGCAFARELSDQSLRAFRAARVKPLPPDKRSWVRFLCNFRALCRRVEPAPVEPCSAKILNVSAAGVGLMVTRRFEVGAPLCVELPIATGDTPTAVPGRVVHAKMQRSGDWVIGCAFNQPLTEEQLRALL
jgi:hypothetical protein